jgi:hypothetical protein
LGSKTGVERKSKANQSQFLPPTTTTAILAQPPHTEKTVIYYAIETYRIIHVWARLLHGISQARSIASGEKPEKEDGK